MPRISIEQDARTLHFDLEDETFYQGKNGEGRCIGIKAVVVHGQGQQRAIRLAPVTSRHRITNACQLEVPASYLGTLVEQLSALKESLQAQGVRMVPTGNSR